MITREKILFFPFQLLKTAKKNCLFVLARVMLFFGEFYDKRKGNISKTLEKEKRYINGTSSKG